MAPNFPDSVKIQSPVTILWSRSGTAIKNQCIPIHFVTLISKDFLSSQNDGEQEVVDSFSDSHQSSIADVEFLPGLFLTNLTSSDDGAISNNSLQEVDQKSHVFNSVEITGISFLSSTESSYRQTSLSNFYYIVMSRKVNYTRR